MSSKDKILTAARDAFHRHGYAATSVDTLLMQTGVSKSNFYYHFRTKEDLGVAVLDRREADMEQLYESTLGSAGASPIHRLEGFVNALAAAQDSVLDLHGCPFGNLVAEMADHSERLRVRLSRMFQRMTAEVAEVVREGQRSGQVAAGIDANVAAHLLVNATQGMHLMAKCHKSLEPTAEACRLMVRLLQDPDTGSPIHEPHASALRISG